MAVPTYTKTGTKATASAKLDKAVFGVDIKSHDLLKAAYDTYLANGRRNLARAKTRGEVVGSTIKPWRQKGTGRARFGSRYNPIWRGGGIVFGPTGRENYSKQMNAKARRQAIRQALSMAAEEGRIKVIETFECKDGKAAPAAKLLDKIEAKGAVLLVVSQKDELVERATRNLPKVKAVNAAYMNVFDVVNADTIVVSKKALEMVTEWLGATPAKRASRSDEEAK